MEAPRAAAREALTGPASRKSGRAEAEGKLLPPREPDAGIAPR